MKLSILIFLFLIYLVVNGATWNVGPTRIYTAPSQVSTLVSSGDTVAIDSGIYVADVAHWTADDLYLYCPNGFARLHSNGLSFGDKQFGKFQETIRMLSI